MSKVHDLTARCPQGCETWLHPRAVWLHTNDPKRCREHPSVDDLADSTLIAAPLAQEVAAILPRHLVSRPHFSGDRLLHPRPTTTSESTCAPTSSSAHPSREFLHNAGPSS